MTSRRGRFVVLEGVDGSGTTTQVARLTARLRAAGIAARATREPSDGPFGALARQVLGGRVVVPGGRAPGWTTMALLFAADRMDHVESEIEPLLGQGAVVVSDRYVASSLAYQSVSSGANAAEALAWIRSLNRYVSKPDLTVVLDVTPETAARRREGRGEAAQIFDQDEMQRALGVFYRDLAKHMPAETIVVIDANAGVQEVEETVWAAYHRALG
jgi:dTMP kinase